MATVELKVLIMILILVMKFIGTYTAGKIWYLSSCGRRRSRGGCAFVSWFVHWGPLHQSNAERSAPIKYDQLNRKIQTLEASLTKKGMGAPSRARIWGVIIYLFTSCKYLCISAAPWFVTHSITCDYPSVD